MRYENIIEMLLSRIPEIFKAYEEEKDYIEGLPHLVFEIVFVPYLKEVMVTDNHKKKIEIISLMEEMIVCEDEKVQEVAVVSVLESLLAERDFLGKIRYQLGLKTQESLLILERDYGWI